jgi:hypothetical protein
MEREVRVAEVVFREGFVKFVEGDAALDVDPAFADVYGAYSIEALGGYYHSSFWYRGTDSVSTVSPDSDCGIGTIAVGEYLSQVLFALREKDCFGLATQFACVVTVREEICGVVGRVSHAKEALEMFFHISTSVSESSRTSLFWVLRLS